MAASGHVVTLAAHAGSFGQFAGVRLMTLGGRYERGIRMLEFQRRHGPALHRAHRPRLSTSPIATIAAWRWVGIRRPVSAIRVCTNMKARAGRPGCAPFPGMMVTCGLDHILFMHDDRRITMSMARARRSAIQSWPHRHDPRQTHRLWRAVGRRRDGAVGAKAQSSRARCSRTSSNSSAASRSPPGPTISGFQTG